MAFRLHKRTRHKYWADCKLVQYLDRNHPSQTTKKKSYTVDELFEHLDAGDGRFESVVDKIQDFVMFPSDFVYSVKVFLKNWKGQTHNLSGTLEVGQWNDLCYRIPHCLFSELEKFIEQEKGLETHEWEKTLTYNEDYGIDTSHENFGKPTLQALTAIEQQEIYDWWKANKDANYISAEESDKYKEKETEMLIRLIKIRDTLWT